MEGRIDRRVRRGRRRKQLLHDLKEWKLHCKLNEEPLASQPGGTHFQRGCEPVVRYTE